MAPWQIAASGEQPAGQPPDKLGSSHATQDAGASDEHHPAAPPKVEQRECGGPQAPHRPSVQVQPFPQLVPSAAQVPPRSPHTSGTTSFGTTHTPFATQDVQQ